MFKSFKISPTEDVCQPTISFHKLLHPLIGMLKKLIHSLLSLSLVQKITPETLVVNQVLAHLTRAIIHEDGLTYDKSNSNIVFRQRCFLHGRKMFWQKISPRA